MQFDSKTCSINISSVALMWHLYFKKIALQNSMSGGYRNGRCVKFHKKDLGLINIGALEFRNTPINIFWSPTSPTQSATFCSIVLCVCYLEFICGTFFDLGRHNNDRKTKTSLKNKNYFNEQMFHSPLHK